jgi:hypothetical protein
LGVGFGEAIAEIGLEGDVLEHFYQASKDNVR